MLFSWLRNRRRQKLLSTPIPSDWTDWLQQHVPHYQTLNEHERAKLHDDVRIFCAEKEWEGCGGLDMSDEVKVTIAGFACLLTLGMKNIHFERVQTILVYPKGYVARGEPIHDGTLVGRSSARVGEAHYRGPVVLSWSEILDDAHAPEFGSNVVIHEFAHQLDMLNGWIDGTPLLKNQEQYRRWQEVMTPDFKRLQRAAEWGGATLLDDYGAENEAEFFAVSVECFFNLPRKMRQHLPDMYDLFRDYFNQDPAERICPWFG